MENNLLSPEDVAKFLVYSFSLHYLEVNNENEVMKRVRSLDKDFLTLLQKQCESFQDSEENMDMIVNIMSLELEGVINKALEKWQAK